MKGYENDEPNPHDADISAIIDALMELHGEEYYRNELALLRKLNEEGCYCEKTVRTVSFRGANGFTMPISSWNYHTGEVVAVPDLYTRLKRVPIPAEDYAIYWHEHSFVHPSYIEQALAHTRNTMRDKFVDEAVRMAVLTPLIPDVGTDCIFQLASGIRCVEYEFNEEDKRWDIRFPLIKQEEEE